MNPGIVVTDFLIKVVNLGGEPVEQVVRHRRRALYFIAFALAQSVQAHASWTPGLEYANQPGLAIIKVHNADPANPSAYDQGYTGLGVRIGVIDTGINPSHVEFQDKIVAGMMAGSHPVWSGAANFVGNLYDTNDDDNGEGHGTHVASIAAARLDGDTSRPQNMQGVAYNASLVIAGVTFEGDPDVSPPQRATLPDLQWARSFDYMVTQGVRVINNSWGDPNSGGALPQQEAQAFSENAPLTMQAMRRALAADAVIVFATGNDRDNPGEGLNPGAPTAQPSYDPSIAAYGGWIAVTSVTSQTSGSLEERMASYADYCGVAAVYCVAAPGGDSISGGSINGAKSGERDQDNIYTDNVDYLGMDGTSMATPMVTGAVALVAEKYSWMSNRNLVSTILTTASEAHHAPSLIYGRGLIDVNRAINGPAIFEEAFEAILPAGATSVFSNPISGDHGLTKLGEGTLRLSGNNSFKGTVQIRNGVLVADTDASLGAEQAQVQIFDGTLVMGLSFTTSADGYWHKSIGVGSDAAVIDTNGNMISYAGGVISTVSDDGSLGTLSFVGAPMTVVADLELNAHWNSNLLISQDIRLSGRGAVLGTLAMNGTYSPGNSPGTVFSPGSVQMGPDALLEIEVDGVGTSAGSGNYDRLVFTSADSRFGANGSLAVVLRGISAPANNSYTPELGQGFEFVLAPGGVSGSFVGLDQPAAGLLPGTQMDLVYGTNTLTLYVTPASYANIGAASVMSNSNRDGLGKILQGIRPATGVREADNVRKALFDGLAPQTATTLPVAMDQLAGVSYVQLIGLAQQNTAFLMDQMSTTPTLDRWDRLANEQSDRFQTDGYAWGRVIGRQSSLSGDGLVGTATDTLGGLVLGARRQVTGQTNLDLAMAYGYSASKLPSNMGSGSAQNLQFSAYSITELDDGYFVQGGIGFGGSVISASRPLSLVGANYDATIRTANIAANVMLGQFVQKSDWAYEWQIGVNYLGMRTFGFSDSGGPNALSVSGQVTNNTSVQPTVSLTAGIPFQANQTDWQFLATLSYAYELADNQAYLNATVLENGLRLQSSAIGRGRLTAGLAITANLSENSVFSLSVNNQFASNWNALSALANLTLRF